MNMMNIKQNRLFVVALFKKKLYNHTVPFKKKKKYNHTVQTNKPTQQCWEVCISYTDYILLQKTDESVTGQNAHT